MAAVINTAAKEEVRCSRRKKENWKSKNVGVK